MVDLLNAPVPSSMLASLDVGAIVVVTAHEGTGVEV